MFKIAKYQKVYFSFQNNLKFSQLFDYQYFILI
jgi:hypothetical protein